MVEISNNLVCLYTAEIQNDGDSYTIEVPKREIEQGMISPGGINRVAILSSSTFTSESTSGVESSSQADRGDMQIAEESPPVEPGDIVDIEIDTLGDQGDGIGRVGPGYVVIVPDTDVDERVSVRITEAKENVAFADVVKRHDH